MTELIGPNRGFRQELSRAKDAVIEAEKKVTAILVTELEKVASLKYQTFYLTDGCTGQHLQNATLIVEDQQFCYAQCCITCGNVNAEFYLNALKDMCIDTAYGPDYRPLIIEVKQFTLRVYAPERK